MASVMDLVVQIFGDGSDFRRDIEEDKQVVDEFSRDVDAKHPAVNVKAKGVEKTEAELEAIQAEADKLDGRDVNINVHERTVGGGSGGGFVAGGGAGGSSGAASGGGRRRAGALLGGAIAAGIGIAPAVLAPALAGVMALSSAFTSAAVGAAGFAAVAIPNIKAITTASSNLTKAQQAYNHATTSKQRQAALLKEKQAVAGLDAQQMKAMKSLRSFESFWTKFTKSFQNPVLKLFTNGLGLLQTLLTEMKPVITGAAKAFNTLMKDAQKALASPFWKNFFQFLGKNAGPMIKDFGEIIGYLAKGFGGLMEAFNPMAKSMMGGLVQLTKHFAHWATSLSKSKGFKKFIDYVKLNGPKVLKIIGNLFKIAGNLMKALAPLGTVILSALKKVSKWVAELTKHFGEWEKHMKGTKIFKQFIDYVKKYGPMMFKTLKNVVKVIINIAKALAPLAKLAIKVFLPITKAIIQVLYWISKLLVWFTSTTKTSKKITADLKKIWGEVESFFKHFVEDVIRWFERLLRSAGHSAEQLWSNVKSSFHNGVSEAKNAVQSLIRSVESYFSNLPNKARHWGKNMISGFIGGIESMFGAVAKAAENTMNQVARFLKHMSPAEEGPGRHVVEWGQNMIGGFIDGINSAAPMLRSTMNSVMQPPEFALGTRAAQMVQGSRHGGAIAPVQHVQNVNYERLFEGAHFHVRDEHDIKKLAAELGPYLDFSMRGAR